VDPGVHDVFHLPLLMIADHDRRRRGIHLAR